MPTLDIACRHCGGRFEYTHRELAGRESRCPHCGAGFRLIQVSVHEGGINTTAGVVEAVWERDAPAPIAGASLTRLMALLADAVAAHDEDRVAAIGQALARNTELGLLNVAVCVGICPLPERREAMNRLAALTRDWKGPARG